MVVNDKIYKIVLLFIYLFLIRDGIYRKDLDGRYICVFTIS